MLTTKQKQTYDFIKSYLEEYEIAPTLTEIAQGINFQSKGSTSRYVSSLVEMGLLGKSKGKGSSRNLYLNNKTLDDINNQSTRCRFNNPIPLVGCIAAGSPIEAISENESYDINDVIRGHNLYMLKVKGESMIEEGIHDGDYVICEQKDSAQDGEIVVALVGGSDATLKRLYRRDHDKVLLCPANSSMTPMEFSAHDVVIQGILRCQLRAY